MKVAVSQQFVWKSSDCWYLSNHLRAIVGHGHLDKRVRLSPHLLTYKNAPPPKKKKNLALNEYEVTWSEWLKNIITGIDLHKSMRFEWKVMPPPS